MASEPRVDEFGRVIPEGAAPPVVADAVVPAAPAPAPPAASYRGDAGAVESGGGRSEPPRRQPPPPARHAPRHEERRHREHGHGRGREEYRRPRSRSPPPGRRGPSSHGGREGHRGPPPSRGSRWGGAAREEGGRAFSEPPPPVQEAEGASLTLSGAALVPDEAPALAAAPHGMPRVPWVEGVGSNAPGGSPPPPPPVAQDYTSWAAGQSLDRGALEAGFKAYLAQHQRQVAHSFYTAHRHQPWFRDLYDPVALAAAGEDRSADAEAAAAVLEERVASGGVGEMVPPPKRVHTSVAHTSGGWAGDGPGASFWGDRARILVVRSVPGFVDPLDVLDAVSAVTAAAREKAAETADFALAASGGAQGEGAVSAAAKVAQAALEESQPPVAVHAATPARGMGRGDVKRTYNAWVEFGTAVAAAAALDALPSDKGLDIKLTRHASQADAALVAAQRARADAFLAGVVAEVAEKHDMGEVAARRARGAGVLDAHGRPVRGGVDAFGGDRRAFESAVAAERRFGELVTREVGKLAGEDAVLGLKGRLAVSTEGLGALILAGATEVWGLADAAATAVAGAAGKASWSALPDIPPAPGCVPSVAARVTALPSAPRRPLAFAVSDPGAVTRDCAGALHLARALDIEAGLSPAPALPGVPTAGAGGDAVVAEDDDSDDGAVAEAPAAAPGVGDAAAFTLVTSNAWLTDAPTRVDTFLAGAAPEGTDPLHRLDALLMYLSWVHLYDWYGGTQAVSRGDWMQVGSDLLHPRIIPDPSVPLAAPAAAPTPAVEAEAPPAPTADAVKVEGEDGKEAAVEPAAEAAVEAAVEAAPAPAPPALSITQFDALPGRACGAVCTLGEGTGGPGRRRMLTTDRVALAWALRMRTARRRVACRLGVPIANVFAVEEKALHMGQLAAGSEAASGLVLAPLAFPFLTPDLARDVNTGQKVVSGAGLLLRSSAVSAAVGAVMAALSQDELLAAWYATVLSSEGEPSETGEVLTRCLLGKGKLFRDRSFAVKYLKKKQPEALAAAAATHTAAITRAVQLRVADAFMWALYAGDTGRVAAHLTATGGAGRALDVALGGTAPPRRSVGGGADRVGGGRRGREGGQRGGYGGPGRGPPGPPGRFQQGGSRGGSRGRRGGYVDADAGLGHRSGPVPGASRVMQGAVSGRVASYGKSLVSYDDI